MEITGAQALVEALLEQGTDTVFGYPGGSVINLFDALDARRDAIRLILPAHEQGGAFGADGYARVSGKCGVVMATSGPGATNLVTGIANAYMDSVPMVAVTGNVPRALMGRDSFQEVDICGVTMPITKHSFLVQHASELKKTIRDAFSIAMSGRPGPVLVDIPKDVSAELCDGEPAGRYEKRPAPEASAAVLRQAADMLGRSARPLIFCGGGVVGGDAAAELTTLAEKLNCPVAVSLMGLGAIPAGHPLLLGLIGMHGTAASNYAGGACDLLLCLGTRFSDRAAGDRTRFAPNARLIQVDIDPSEFDKNVACDLHIGGDVKAVLKRLGELVPARSETAWLSEIRAFAEKNTPPEMPEPEHTHPRGVMRAIGQAIGENGILVTDVGQHQMWAAQYYPVSRPRGFITSGGLGAMGFGLGAAVGAKLAEPERPVVLVTGDGSFHMNLPELATCVTHNLPVVVVVMNNTVLGMVRQWQKMFYDGRYAGTMPNRPTDFAKLGEAFGGLGFRADTMAAFREALALSLGSNRVCVIDCAIDPEETVFPMIPPGKSGKDILYGEGDIT